MFAPPLDAGAVKDTDAWPEPSTVATPMLGASGTLAGTIVFEATLAALGPAILVAVTLKI